MRNERTSQRESLEAVYSLPLERRRRPRPLRRWRDWLSLSVLSAVSILIVSIVWLNGRAIASVSPTAQPLNVFAATGQDMSGVDFSKFRHDSQHHISLACASCHQRAADNSPRPTLPGHKACTGCHLAQFVTQNIPMCAICHTDLNSQHPPVKAFPGIQSFNAKFDHAQHNTGAARPENGCVACHNIASRRSAAMTIPVNFNAHAECYTCHTPNAQANGRDIASCGVCHSLGRFTRTSIGSRAFNASFSHATHGPRQRLDCADCHNLRAGAAQSLQVTSTRPLQHFASGRAQSCMTCHNDRRAFGDANFGDCRRCHKSTTFRM